MSAIISLGNKNSHADGICVGETGGKVGFLGTAPVVLQASANQAVATDAASVIVLANALRTALLNVGLIKGSA